MAVFTYGSNNISLGNAGAWANSESQNSDTSLAGIFDDFYPDNAAPYQVSEFSPNTSIFKGALTSGTGGSVEVTAPYTTTAANSVEIKNFDISTYSLSVKATTAYPYTFVGWYDSIVSPATLLTTNATLTLTDSDHTGVLTFYAHFSTTHVTP